MVAVRYRHDMPRRCSVCDHPGRPTIEASIVEGGTIRSIARQHGLSAASLHRHGKKHLAPQSVRNRDSLDADRGQSLWTRLATLETDAERLKARAESDGDLRTALAAVREQTRLLDLAFRIHTDRAVPLEQALRIVKGLASALQRHVSDPITLARIRYEFRELTGDSTMLPEGGVLDSAPGEPGGTR